MEAQEKTDAEAAAEFAEELDHQMLVQCCKMAGYHPGVMIDAFRGYGNDLEPVKGGDDEG